MSTSNGFLQGFNAQAVANAEQLVVAAEVTDEQNDARQFDPLIEATQASLDDAGITARPEKLVAGYASEENFAALGEDDPDAYVATRNMKNNPAARTGRRGPLRKDAKLVERMDRKVPNKAGRALYRHRQQLIEPVFGQIKDARHIHGFIQKGKAAADAEWKVICGTHNLLKLYYRARLDPALAPYSWMVVGAGC